MSRVAQTRGLRGLLLPGQSVNRDRRHAPRRLPIDTQDLTRRATPRRRRPASPGCGCAAPQSAVPSSTTSAPARVSPFPRPGSGPGRTSEVMAQAGRRARRGWGRRGRHRPGSGGSRRVVAFDRVHGVHARRPPGRLARQRPGPSPTHFTVFAADSRASCDSSGLRPFALSVTDVCICWRWSFADQTEDCAMRVNG